MLTLGQETQRGDKIFIVVRIVDSVTLFEEDDGKCYSLKEMYAELRGPNNEIEFISLLETESMFEKKSELKALPPLLWRVKK